MQLDVWLYTHTSGRHRCTGCSGVHTPRSTAQAHRSGVGVPVLAVWEIRGNLFCFPGSPLWLPLVWPVRSSGIEDSDTKARIWCIWFEWIVCLVDQGSLPMPKALTQGSRASSRGWSPTALAQWPRAPVLWPRAGPRGFGNSHRLCFLLSKPEQNNYCHRGFHPSLLWLLFSSVLEVNIPIFLLCCLNTIEA